jgi:hypothetical protein
MRIRAHIVRWTSVFAFCILTASQAAAGWVFFSDGTQEQQTTYIEDNRLKFAAPDHIMIFNITTNRIAFINPDMNTYWEGAPETFAASAKLTSEDIEDMIEENLEEVPPQEQEVMAESLRRQMLRQTGGPPPTVIVNPTPAFETIAGYRARKHEIHINGELRQELWIADGIEVSTEFDVDEYGRMLRTFHSTLGFNVETAFSDPNVIALYKKGWPLRTVTYDEEGYPDKTEVTDVVRKPLMGTVFEVPSNYRELSSKEIFGQ